MNNQAIILTLYAVVPGATVRVTAVPLIAARTCPRTAVATAAFGSVSTWTAYNELRLTDSRLDSLCFAILVSRPEIVLGVDPFCEN
jgi:hypothetical protein